MVKSFKKLIDRYLRDGKLKIYIIHPKQISLFLTRQLFDHGICGVSKAGFYVF